MNTARDAALKALISRRRNGVRLDAALAEASKGLSSRDAALAARLCFGVTQTHALIDLALKGLAKNPQPQVLDILRLGAYQLWFLDRVPRHAITDEAVRLCKKTAPHAAGMVNAILRRLPDEPPKTDDLAIRYSLPRWFCDKMASILPPDELEPFFISCNAVPPIYIQPEGFALEDPSELDGLLKSGRGVVADPAAKRAVDVLGPEPGSSLWDACAAPGGKTAMSAFAMRNQGRILATDKDARKLPLITETLGRCGLTIAEVKQADAAAYRPDGLFDAVLCDVPCSGFGVLRKKPDIRYRTEVAHFPALQGSILRNAAAAVRPGGTLVYCTCTLFPEENEDVIRAFMTGGFTVESMETLWPHKQETDGFFICRMTKN
ncbi:MAG: 16S rRNA (cytosine(967)-C(5))-methyltransferase RsmB [Oscillospiraceae bacterium]|nr:16S rRNA (cytosine(967)-C(5))-methyltransferase RsmB [Oscillospiraceae bacterium]